MHTSEPRKFLLHHLLKIQVFHSAIMHEVSGRSKFQPRIIHRKVGGAPFHQQEQPSRFQYSLNLLAVLMAIINCRNSQRVNHTVKLICLELEQIVGISLLKFDLHRHECAILLELILFLDGLHQHVRGPVYQRQVYICLVVLKVGPCAASHLERLARSIGQQRFAIFAVLV